MLGCIYSKFEQNEQIINGTFQHLAIEVPANATIVIQADGQDKRFIVSHQRILEFNEPIIITGMYFENPTEALITYTT